MKRKLPSGLIFLLIVLALIACFLALTRPPSEAQMIDKFHANKAQFEQLRLMMAQDNLESV